MLEAFELKYGDPDGPVPRSAATPSALREVAGDKVFGGGLYRVLSDARVESIMPELFRAYPDYEGLAECFATDWMGNLFAVHARSKQVLLFELASCEVLGIGVPFDIFHLDLLVNDADAAVAEPLFRRWCEAGGAVPGPEQCVGYTKPLFLGGTDDIGNLGITDLDVYWTITSQVIQQRGVREKIIGNIQAS